MFHRRLEKLREKKLFNWKWSIILTAYPWRGQALREYLAREEWS
ncbi:hypothetical protein [Peribacillus simplex]